jgi:hypothetical protein
MFRVAADTLEAYLDFDPKRKSDLAKWHQLMRMAAPSLARYFHRGTPAGEAGMRMKMIGYGRFRYTIKSGKAIEWPAIGIALQKNYISVYVSVTKAGAPIVPGYARELGELRMGSNNFSFLRFDDLNILKVSELLSEVADILGADPDNPVRYMTRLC